MPTLTERLITRLALVGALVTMATTPAHADPFPSKTIKIVVPYAAGGITDILARLVSVPMTRELGQPVVVENRPGAATALGAEYVAHAVADGHTLMMATTSTFITSPLLFPKLAYKREDLIPVSLVASTAFIMVVGSASPFQTVGDLVGYAKANPGKLNCATVGVGSSGHLTCEMFHTLAGVDIESIHYKGSAPALTDLMGNQVQLYFDGISTSLPHMAAGSIRALGVTSATRSSAAPTIPTLVEAGYPKMLSTTLYGVVAPRGTPPDVVARLNRIINEAVSGKEISDRLGAEGADKVGNLTAEQFGAVIERDTALWQGIISGLNIRLD